MAIPRWLGHCAHAQSHDPQGETYNLNCLSNISLDLRQHPQAVGY